MKLQLISEIDDSFICFVSGCFAVAGKSFKINTSRAAAVWDFGGFDQTKSQRDERNMISYDSTYIFRAFLTKIHCCWRLIICTIHSGEMFVDAIHDLLNFAMFSLWTSHKQRLLRLSNLHQQFLLRVLGELTAPHSRHVFNRKFDGAEELFMCWITLDGVNNFLSFVFFGTGEQIDTKSV